MKKLCTKTTTTKMMWMTLKVHADEVDGECEDENVRKDEDQMGDKK